MAAALLGLPTTAPAQVTTELDAYWAEVSRTVEEGDFEGYAELYHPDAVLVMQGQGTVPIGEALAARTRERSVALTLRSPETSPTSAVITRSPSPASPLPAASVTPMICTV